MPGFVRSDLTAIVRLYNCHYVSPSREDAIAEGLKAGVDLQLYDYPHQEWQEGIKNLLRSGKHGFPVKKAGARLRRHYSETVRPPAVSPSHSRAM